MNRPIRMMITIRVLDGVDIGRCFAFPTGLFQSVAEPVSVSLADVCKDRRGRFCGAIDEDDNDVDVQRRTDSDGIIKGPKDRLAHPSVDVVC